MIPLRDQDFLRQRFAQELRTTVKIELFTEREMGLYVPGREPCAGCKPTREMLQELAGLSDRVSLRIHILEEDREDARKYGVDKIPAVVLRGRDGHSLKFYGMPGGNEFPTFVETIVDLSQGRSLLSEDSKGKLRKLKQDVRVQVMVTPTCPHCPRMARAAYHLALASPHIAAEVVDISEFPELAQRYRVKAVPMTIIDDKLAIPGAVDEKVLVEEVVKAAAGSGSGLSEPTEVGPSTPAAPVQPPQPKRGQRDSGIIIP